MSTLRPTCAHAVRAMALTAILVLGGCFSSSAPTASYVLGHPPDAQPVDQSQLGRPVVEIRPVRVPDFLDTRDILVRIGANQVRAEPDGRWAERLSIGIGRALAGALEHRLGDMAVTTTAPVTPSTWQVQVDVDTFEISLDGPCLFGARWSIVDGHDRTTPVRSQYVRFVIPPAGPGDAASVAAMTQAIDQLAGQIAPALQQVRGTTR